jgi:hypothetical protein
MDPIIESNEVLSQLSDNEKEDPSLKTKNVSFKNQYSGKVSKSSGGSGFLIGVIAIFCLIGLFYFAYQNDTPSSSSLNSLDTREDISKYTINGELAEAFNLNSKNTDIQRENLLKQIKGQVVIWEVTVYEVKKDDGTVYKIQTSGGLNLGGSDVGTFIYLTSKDEDQKKFIEGLRTGNIIRIKGILSGESFLRSLVIKPAILWHPEQNKKTDNSAVSSDNKVSRIEDPPVNIDNINLAIKRLVKEYKDSGMLGSSILVENCYEELSKIKESEIIKYSKFEQCVSMDLAAYRIDTDTSSATNFPPTDYFVLKNISDRIDLQITKNHQWKFSDDRTNSIVELVYPKTRIEMQMKN